MSESLLKPVTTNLSWKDFKANDTTLERLNTLKESLKNLQVKDEDNITITKAHTVLFQGPAGSGKSLAAALIGNEFSKPVYEIDLSKLVSKYIGETEKNLDKIFDPAEEGGAILLFDEADALFGKRTDVKDSHDRYANMEISYLMQRIQTYPGLAVIATRTKNNIDDAFTRRFHSIVQFPPYV